MLTPSYPERASTRPLRPRRSCGTTLLLRQLCDRVHGEQRERQHSRQNKGENYTDHEGLADISMTVARDIVDSFSRCTWRNREPARRENRVGATCESGENIAGREHRGLGQASTQADEQLVYAVLASAGWTGFAPLGRSADMNTDVGQGVLRFGHPPRGASRPPIPAEARASSRQRATGARTRLVRNSAGLRLDEPQTFPPSADA